MKKFCIVMLVLLVLLVAACVLVFALSQNQNAQMPQQPENPLEAVRTQMSEVDSMRFTMKMNMDVSVFRQEMDVDLAMAGEMTAAPSVAHGQMTMTMGQEEPTEMEVYMETVNGETVTYVGMPVDGRQVWSTQRGTSAGLGSGLQSDTAELLSMIKLAAGTEPEQTSETELRYTGVIPAEKICLALQTTGMLTRLEETGMLDAALLNQTSGELEDMPLTVTVDRERQVITGYQLDMTAVVRQILLASLEQSAAELGLDTKPEEMLEVTAVTTEMTFFDHGLVQPIVIPDAVKTEE